MTNTNTFQPPKPEKKYPNPPTFKPYENYPGFGKTMTHMKSKFTTFEPVGLGKMVFLSGNFDRTVYQNELRTAGFKITSDGIESPSGMFGNLSEDNSGLQMRDPAMRNRRVDPETAHLYKRDLEIFKNAAQKAGVKKLEFDPSVFCPSFNQIAEGILPVARKPSNESKVQALAVSSGVSLPANATISKRTFAEYLAEAEKANKSGNSQGFYASVRQAAQSIASSLKGLVKDSKGQGPTLGKLLGKRGIAVPEPASLQPQTAPAQTLEGAIPPPPPLEDLNTFHLPPQQDEKSFNMHAAKALANKRQAS